MDCEDVRTYLLDEHRGQLAPELGREVRTHLERCAACAHEDAAERALGELLERRLPQHPAPRGTPAPSVSSPKPSTITCACS